MTNSSHQKNQMLRSLPMLFWISSFLVWKFQRVYDTIWKTLYIPCNHKKLSFLNPLGDVITVCQNGLVTQKSAKTTISVQINLGGAQRPEMDLNKIQIKSMKGHTL